MKTHLVFWKNGGKIGTVDNTPANRADAFRIMHLSPIQKDCTGTEHFEVLAVRKGA